MKKRVSSLMLAAVLAAAWQGGIAAGAVLGMAAGLSMDLAANGVPLYAMAFGLSGLATGAVRGKRSGDDACHDGCCGEGGRRDEVGAADS